MLRFEGIVGTRTLLSRLDPHALAAVAGAAAWPGKWERGGTELAAWRLGRVHELIAHILEDPTFVEHVCAPELAHILLGDAFREPYGTIPTRVREAVSAIRAARGADPELARVCDDFVGGKMHQPQR